MSAWTTEVTEANFDSRVLAASHERPVLVDFWAGWCGPCKMLMPVLEAIVESYQGKVLLAKVDTDQEQKLAGQWGVRSLPTVKLFRKGVVVDEFMGVQPESVIRQLIDKHLPRPADDLLDELERDIAAGKAPEELLRRSHEALELDPDYPRAHLIWIRILLLNGAHDEAATAIENLPADLRLGDEVRQLQSELRLKQAAGDLDSIEQALENSPEDCALWLKRAAALVSNGQWQEGLDTYVKVLEKGGAPWREQARSGLLAAFDLIDDRALVNRYRRRMSALIF